MGRIKIPNFEKNVQLTVSVHPMVEAAVKDRAKEENLTVSKLVNLILRKIVVNDTEFYSSLAKHHNAMMYHYKSLAEGILK